MDIHKLFQSSSFPYIAGGVKQDLKEQLGFGGDANEFSQALLAVDVQGHDLSEFTVKALQSRKPGILKVSTLKEIEKLLAMPQKDTGFSIALINTDLGAFYPAILEALRWDPEIIIVNKNSLDDFSCEEKEMIERAAMTGHAVYLVKEKN